MSKNNWNFLMPFQDVASDGLKRSNQLVPFKSDEWKVLNLTRCFEATWGCCFKATKIKSSDLNQLSNQNHSWW